MKNCFMTCLQSVFLEVQRMWRGGRGIKEDGESSELSKESLGFSLCIFCDACDVKIKRNPSPQGFSVCTSDAKTETAHLAGEGASSWHSKSPICICISCSDLNRIF